jgi:hypothetical protein
LAAEKLFVNISSPQPPLSIRGWRGAGVRPRVAKLLLIEFFEKLKKKTQHQFE